MEIFTKTYRLFQGFFGLTCEMQLAVSKDAELYTLMMHEWMSCPEKSRHTTKKRNYIEISTEEYL